MGTGVCRSNTETPGSEPGPCACNPKPLSRSLHLLNETIGLQLFLGNLQGKEKRQIFQNHGSVERAPLPKDSAFLSPFSMWQVIVNY